MTTMQIDIQEALERGFDVQGLKTRAVGLENWGKVYRYLRSVKNPVGVEVLIFEEVRNGCKSSRASW